MEEGCRYFSPTKVETNRDGQISIGGVKHVELPATALSYNDDALDNKNTEAPTSFLHALRCAQKYLSVVFSMLTPPQQKKIFLPTQSLFREPSRKAREYFIAPFFVQGCINLAYESNRDKIEAKSSVRPTNFGRSPAAAWSESVARVTLLGVIWNTGVLPSVWKLFRKLKTRELRVVKNCKSISVCES